MRNIMSAFILAVGVATVGLYLFSGIKYFKNFDRYVEVKGLAEQVVQANQSLWQISYTASNNDLKQIYNSIYAEQQSITTFLVNQGFNKSEIQIQPASITDNYANSYSSGAKTRYSASASLTLVTPNVHKVASAVQLTNNLVQQGVIITASNLNYTYDKLNDIKTALLNEALTNAKKSAQEFAYKSNSTLGGIRTASQGLITIAATGGGGGDGGSASISKKVRVVTTVQFFLK